MTDEAAKSRICLWFNHDAEDAAAFYAATFPDTRITKVWRAPSDYPDGKAGEPIVVEFAVMGTACIGLNGGPQFAQTQAFSFYILTDDQAETDRYWDAIVGNGGAESQCGWCKDRWGVSWQIVPRALHDGMTDPDPAAAKRVMDAMMTMRRIDVGRIEAARRGKPS